MQRLFAFKSLYVCANNIYNLTKTSVHNMSGLTQHLVFSDLYHLSKHVKSTGTNRQIITV